MRYLSQSAPAAPKAKAQHVSKKEPVFEEPEVEVTSSLDDVQVDVVFAKGETEVEHKVACLDGERQVSADTLKCSHGPNCVVKKQRQIHTIIISRVYGGRSFGAEAAKEQEYQSRMRN